MKLCKILNYIFADIQNYPLIVFNFRTLVSVLTIILHLCEWAWCNGADIWGHELTCLLISNLVRSYYLHIEHVCACVVGYIYTSGH